MPGKCTKVFTKSGICVCPFHRAQRHPAWVEFWATWHQEQGFTRSETEAWFASQAKQPWMIEMREAA
jgi:hypothetical protein